VQIKATFFTTVGADVGYKYRHLNSTNGDLFSTMNCRVPLINMSAVLDKITRVISCKLSANQW